MTMPSSFLSPTSLSLSLILLLVQVLHAQTQNYNITAPAVIVFGDSIVDPGNNNALNSLVKCNFPPYGQNFAQHKPTGRFSNGKIPSDLIASALNVKELLPAYLDPNLKPEDLLTGVSFASGGCGYDSLTAKLASVYSLSDQLKLFKEYKEKLKAIVGEDRAASIISDSPYVVITGTDDLANTYYSTPYRSAHYDIPSYTNLIVQSASKFYQELYKLGARKMAIGGLPPIGCLPSQRTTAGGIRRDCVDSRNKAATYVNNKLSQEIQKLNSTLPGAKLIYMDIYTGLLNLIRRPFDYGFEVSNKGCCGFGIIEVSILCNPLSLTTCKDVSKYVFWDSYHPTEKAYEVIVSNLVKNVIVYLQ